MAVAVFAQRPLKEALLNFPVAVEASRIPIPPADLGHAAAFDAANLRIGQRLAGLAGIPSHGERDGGTDHNHMHDQNRHERAKHKRPSADRR